MDIKYTVQGLLIYAAIATYMLAFVTAAVHAKKAATRIFILAFLVSLAAVIYRWLHVGHIPMQNLFEVFLCLGALIHPLSILCRRILNTATDGVDMLIGGIVLFPAGFVFNAEVQQLPPALQYWLFAPHVAVYMISYILMFKAAHQAILQLASAAKVPTASVESEKRTYILVCLAFPLLTLGLVLGSVWGQLAWGDWWGWDPKELWSLASWLVYVGYFHFRYMFGARYPRANSVWAIAGAAIILITLLWVNLSRLFPGLHSYAM